MTQKKTSLWILGLSPLVWSHHFLFSYVFAAVWCAKASGRSGDIKEVRTAISIVTALSLLVVAREIYKGYQKHKSTEGELPHDDDTPEDREKFLGFARFLISCLSFVAIVFNAYVAFVFRSCW